MCPQKTPELVDVLNSFDLPYSELEFSFQELYDATSMHDAVSAFAGCSLLWICAHTRVLSSAGM